jgi:hypothetical protein
VVSSVIVSPQDGCAAAGMVKAAQKPAVSTIAITPRRIDLEHNG